MPDIKKMDWRELQTVLDERQTGQLPDTEQPWLSGWDPSSQTAGQDFRTRFLNNFNVNPDAPEMQRMADVESRISEIVNDPTDYTQESIELGYGATKRDTDVPYEIWRENPRDARAKAQSAAAKVVNGALKGLLAYAPTTFFDNTVGLVMGIGSVAGNAVDAIQGEDKFKFNSFVNTKFARWMNVWREWSDKILPNYRTDEEVMDADHWWRHINANFWGDTFLKNFGFTIGAGASGALYAKGFSKLFGKATGEAYKAGLAASRGDKEMETVFRQILQGAEMKNPEGFTKAFDQVRRKYARLGAEANLIGSVGASIGESRTEALQAAKEFREQQISALDQKYEQDKNALALEVMSNPAFLGERLVYDGFGNIIGTEPVLNQDGIDYFEKSLSDLRQEYQKKYGALDVESEALANTTFLLNMPTLTLSNMVMFGRMFSGGFKTQSNFKVKGTFGKYKGSGSLANDIFRGLVVNAGTEGTEELVQKMISEGAKDIASGNIAHFNDGNYDRTSIKTFSKWMTSMLNSSGNVLIDPKSWEEFAVGWLTGSIGMKVRGGWAGGLVGAIQQGREQRYESNELARQLNERIASPEMKALYEGLVHHIKMENIKDYALKKPKDAERFGFDFKIKDYDGNDVPVGRQFVWQTADDEQLINDVVMFARAGRLNDLESYVDSFANIKESDIPDIRESLLDETDPNFQNKSNAQILDWLQQRASAVKTAINEYRTMRDAIDYLSFGTTDDDAINELIFTQMQMKNFEYRFNTLRDKTFEAIRPTIERVSRELDRMDNPTERAQRARKILNSESEMQRIFGGYALDIKGRAQDEKHSEAADDFVLLDDVNQAKILAQLEEWGAFADKPELKENVQDMQALVRSRQNFYAKLFDPRGRQSFAAEFKQKKKKAEDEAKALEADADKQKAQSLLSELDGATTLSEYIAKTKEIGERETVDEKVQDELDKLIKGNSKLDGFEKRISSADSFVNGLREAITKRSVVATPEQKDELEKVADALNTFNHYDVLATMDDSADGNIEIAKTLLDAMPDDGSANVLRSILEEKLGDSAQANGLGVIDPGEDSGREDDGGEDDGSGDGTGGGGNVTQFDRVNDLIKNITDVRSSVLDKISKGDFSDYPGLTDEEQERLTADAKQKLLELKKAAGLLSDVSDDDDKKGKRENLNPDEAGKPKDSPERVQARKDFRFMESGAISGTPRMVYNPTEAAKGRKVRGRATKGEHQDRTNATISWLIKHGVHEFVDSGALAKLEQAYRNDEKRLPIYFLANPHYVENNLENNPFVIEYEDKDGKTKPSVTMLLAIELNKKNRGILESYDHDGFFSDEKLISVEENGETVQYQVIGEVSRPTNEELDKKATLTIGGKEVLDDSLRERYGISKENAEKIWTHVVQNSILPRYRADRKARTDFKLEGKWYVGKNHPNIDLADSESGNADYSTGERIFTTINYIQSGRNETRKIGQEEYEKVPLRDSLLEYESNGGEYYFAMQGRGVMNYTNGAPALPQAIDTPKGSLWIATQEANGEWAWSYVTVERTGNYDFDSEANAGSKLIQEMNAALDTIFKPLDHSADLKVQHKLKQQAVDTLTNLFYPGVGNTIRFFFNGNAIGITVGEQGEFYDRASFLQAIKEKNFRFQVKVEDLNDPERMGDLIDAGVLTSEMRSFTRFGANIGVNFMEDTDADGNPVPLYVVNSVEPFARTAGSGKFFATGTRTNGEVKNVRIGDTGYQLNDDGSVSTMASKFNIGKPVENPILVAQVKALADLIQRRENGTLNKFAGKRWKLDFTQKIKTKQGEKEIQYGYSELYETEVDGIIVHVVRNARNGAFMLAYSDDYWNDLLSHATPFEDSSKRKFVGDAPISKQEDEGALNAARDEAFAKEEGGSVPPPGPKAPRKRMSAKDRLRAQKDKIGSPGSKTVEQATKDDARSKEEDHCG